MRRDTHLAGAAAAAQEQHQDVKHEHDGAIHLQGVCSHVDAPLIALTLTGFGSRNVTQAHDAMNRQPQTRRASGRASGHSRGQSMACYNTLSAQLAKNAHNDGRLAQVEAAAVLAQGGRPPVLQHRKAHMSN